MFTQACAPENNMSVPLLICDDSAMARKQVVKALPAEWDVDITLATNGVEALDAIRQGRGEVVLLDLTMPEIDGYDVLERVRSEGLKAAIIVISADIQPEARDRVMKFGALDFIKKPVDHHRLHDALRKCGLI